MLASFSPHVAYNIPNRNQVSVGPGNLPSLFREAINHAAEHHPTLFEAKGRPSTLFNAAPPSPSMDSNNKMFLPDPTRTISTHSPTAVSQGLQTATNNLRQSNTDYQLLLAETRKELAEAKHQPDRVSAAGEALNEKLKQTEAEVRKLTKWKFVLPRFEMPVKEATPPPPIDRTWKFLKPGDEGYVDMSDESNSGDAVRSEDDLEVLRRASDYGEMERIGTQREWQLCEISDVWPNPGFPWLRGETPPVEVDVEEDEATQDQSWEDPESSEHAMESTVKTESTITVEMKSTVEVVNDRDDEKDVEVEDRNLRRSNHGKRPQRSLSPHTDPDSAYHRTSHSPWYDHYSSYSSSPRPFKRVRSHEPLMRDTYIPPEHEVDTYLPDYARSSKRVNQSICIHCWTTDRGCDSLAPCLACAEENVKCVRIQCKDGAKCRHARCALLHEGDWEDEDLLELNIVDGAMGRDSSGPWFKMVE
ncbi:unnamed protein product [Zymoseptoria tritici ST99CH_1E4]|uniref:Zn(2)-C6 fungal-type domain-containing protein n=1 Tax=Zymoseptoria tritici ST99CH_1E4 TaxID=1276532 RepID=A0A2H1FZP0_ZYMTR|nr:unnamed protein product [Zymoseptoria tritici ST99CH_1E4]